MRAVEGTLATPFKKGIRDRKALLRATDLVAEKTKGEENRQSNCVIGKAQVEDAAEASFFGAEETGKAKPDPFGTTGAHNGIINHDGIIVLGRMKFQHDVASHRNALARAHAASSERQIRQCPFDDDALAGIMGGTNLCRILDRDSVIVAARICFELAEEGCKAIRTELAPNRIDGQNAEQAIGHAFSRRQPRF